MENHREDFYSHKTNGQVKSVCWAPPVTGNSYNDMEFLFLSGTRGSVQEITLWGMINPELSFDSAPEFIPQVNELGSLKHKGDVNCIRTYGNNGIVTASSLGNINFFRLQEEEHRDRNNSINERERVLVHTTTNSVHSNNAGTVPCNAVSVQPINGSGQEIVSCGEDGVDTY
ncbi:hypothetical protein BB559_003123 [Furculomyces boomerangus]|uniref:Uncharacterized protein n=1 Tax=Furculomyces boomerangus TaxID=61424 RepID=A0A2T9YNT3_9FUNG|nr:hypothetical protein BB559_003123 [Furculomyces boomerangus]